MNVTGRKRPLAYVPWVALIAFLFIFVGIIVWATGMNSALSNTNAALTALSVESEGYLDTIHSAAVGAVVVCSILSTVMVLMSGGRTCLEKAVDNNGKPVCGSWLWLATEAVLSAVWWIIMFWLVFVIFGSCLWYGAAYTVQGVLQVSINTANANNGTGTITGINGTIVVNGTAVGIYNCPNTCLNLAIFDFLVQKDICVCDYNTINNALAHTNKAYNSLGSVVAGSFLMWVGASFLLMNAVADFAKTKRERELLLRAQRAAADAAAAQLALGTAGMAPGMYGSGYPNDSLPLLKTQQLQQQALQQQQMQLQMQMMAQAQAARPTAAPASHTGMSASSSAARLGGNAV